MSWRIGDSGYVNRWRPGQEPPWPFIEHVAKGGTVVAHNAAFERAMWNIVLRRRDFAGCAWWPELKAEQQDCTMARGQAMALPAGLDQLGKALKTTIQKDAAGHRLMMQMCKPRRIEEDGTIVWWEDDERVENLQAYCDQDVETETLVDKGIPHLTLQERRLWALNETINERGVSIDIHSVERALEIVDIAKKRADERMWWLTDGEVKKCTETAKIVAWLNGRGVYCTSVAKGEIEELVLTSQLVDDATAEEVIRLRRAAARTSTDKYKAMLRAVCADGRLRGMFVYHAASTGRFAGRIVQLQNLIRIGEDDLSTILTILELLAMPKSKAELYDLIEMIAGPPIEWLSKCLRSMLVAGPGKKFVSGDFSNIEGRVGAWLGDETWKLDAFRAYDAGTGADLYKLSFAASFGFDVNTVNKAQRQIGKVQELALGYQGSVGAYISMGANYGIKPGDVSAVARAAATEDEWYNVASSYSDAMSRGLEQQVWTGVKLVVNGWRAAHPKIVQSWWDLQDAAIEAVGSPGMIVPVLNGRVKYRAADGFLFCLLPSGRVISYADPQLVWKETENGGRKMSVRYWGVDSMTKRWGPHHLNGGLQFENIDQAIARDLLVGAMFRVEDAGYPLVMHVHDEGVSEVDTGFGSPDHYASLMIPTEKWAEGLPVAAAAWEDTRYVK